ncbi:MAG: Hgd 1 [Chloroflexi bacterium]|nr:Hgd 1 [Chloroflexota bacterium]
METVGVVGVGAMGSVFVERFIAAGVKTLVYDVSPVAIDRAIGLGGEACPSAQALARESDIVHVMVRNDAQMLECVLGSGGILDGLSAGKVLVLDSTVHPSTTRKIAEAARPRGIGLADACIGGIPAVLRAGDSSVIVGGDPDLVERIRPHLSRIGTVYHVGPVGSGNVTKIVKNLILGAHRLIISEGLQIAVAAGVEPLRVLEVLQHESPTWDRPENTFDYGPGLTFNKNLTEQILPPVERLADELAVVVPITRLLIGMGKEQA